MKPKPREKRKRLLEIASFGFKFDMFPHVQPYFVKEKQEKSIACFSLINTDRLVSCVFVAAGKCLPSLFLSTAVFSGSAIIGKETQRHTDNKMISKVHFPYFEKKK